MLTRNSQSQSAKLIIWKRSSHFTINCAKNLIRDRLKWIIILNLREKLMRLIIISTNRSKLI